MIETAVVERVEGRRPLSVVWWRLNVAKPCLYRNTFFCGYCPESPPCLKNGNGSDCIGKDEDNEVVVCEEWPCPCWQPATVVRMVAFEEYWAGRIRRSGKANGVLSIPPELSRERRVECHRLIMLYWGAKMSMPRIADRLGMSYQAVQTRMRRLGIPRRCGAAAAKVAIEKLNEDEKNQREQLRGLYWDERLTIAEVAERLGVTPGVIGGRMVKLGVERRPSSARRQRTTEVVTMNG